MGSCQPPRWHVDVVFCQSLYKLTIILGAVAMRSVIYLSAVLLFLDLALPLMFSFLLLWELFRNMCQS